MTDKGAKCTDGQLFMLGNREVDALARLGHDYMAVYLADDVPAAFSKAFAASLPEMIASRATRVRRRRGFRAGWKAGFGP
jgi:hypothetical protein